MVNVDYCKSCGKRVTSLKMYCTACVEKQTQVFRIDHVARGEYAIVNKVTGYISGWAENRQEAELSREVCERAWGEKYAKAAESK